MSGGRVQRMHHMLLLLRLLQRLLLRLRCHILCLQWSRSLQRMAVHSTHLGRVGALGRR